MSYLISFYMSVMASVIGAVKPFFVGYAQIRKRYKKPVKPFQNWLRGLLYVWWSNGGQGALR